MDCLAEKEVRFRGVVMGPIAKFLLRDGMTTSLSLKKKDITSSYQWRVKIMT